MRSGFGTIYWLTLLLLVIPVGKLTLWLMGAIALDVWVAILLVQDFAFAHPANKLGCRPRIQKGFREINDDAY